MSVVTVDREGHVLAIGVNRPEAHNLWDLEVIQEVSRAYRLLGDDDDLRVGVRFGHGNRFSAALASARAAERAAREAAAAVLVEFNEKIVTSADAMEGMAAMLERRDPVFPGE